jgi:hypothetical protein
MVTPKTGNVIGRYPCWLRVNQHELSTYTLPWQAALDNAPLSLDYCAAPNVIRSLVIVVPARTSVKEILKKI